MKITRSATAGETHLVGDHHHRHTLGGELLHHPEHLVDQLRIQRGGHFVEQHRLGLQHERPGDAGALLLAAGEPVRILPQLVA